MKAGFPAGTAWAGALPLIVICLPVAAGLGGTLLPAFGWLPALGGEKLSLDPFRDFLATPGIGRSLWLSFGTGLATTGLALVASMLILATLHDTGAFRLVKRLLSPLLSVPHAAAAFGLAFVLAPSGWIARIMSPWATGWDAPPDILIVNDPWGLSLVAGLAAKEVPFLILMSLAALSQIRTPQALAVAQSLGYGRTMGWIKGVFPQLYRQIRLPVFAVLAFSISNVEVALILGPNAPSPLAVRLTEWMRDPDLSLWFKAAAGSMVQIGLVLAAITLWVLAELGCTRLGRHWIAAGGRGRTDRIAKVIGCGVAILATIPIGLGLISLGVWSIAGYWGFPDPLPGSFTLKGWDRAASGLVSALQSTLIIALGAIALALPLTLASLESETRRVRRSGRITRLILFLPLLVPQISFLFGLQILLVMLKLDGRMLAVIAAHAVFVLPYMMLALSDPWHALDPRYGHAAAGLGASHWRVFWTLRLPLLATPILTAIAVGLAVSIGLYLPTLIIGAGRVETLTTEAIALASGGDRRLIGVYGLAQMILPMAGFLVATLGPAILWRHRAAMRSMTR